jgi:nicotinic acid mononucleotide adenylyltransferase
MIGQVVKSVALFGGAFDPPHNGHFAIIDNLKSV